MNFRLAELSRRFQDIIDHLTNKPFTWGQGDGTLSDQTDLQEALDEKANLEGGNVFSGEQKINGNITRQGNTGTVDYTRLLLRDNVSSNPEGIWILLGEIGTGVKISGLITGVANSTDIHTARGNLFVDFQSITTPSQDEDRCIATVKSDSPIGSAALRQVNFNGKTYLSIQVGTSSLNFYPRQFYFTGTVLSEPPFVPIIAERSEISGGTAATLFRSTTKLILADNTRYRGDVQVDGDITASDFITQSRVESHTENALSALENLPEWLTEDGKIDYKKHYAYAPRIVTDEEGNVLSEEPGLSMEKRVAIMEKCLHEIYKEKLEEIKADQTQRIELIAQKIEAAGDLSQEIERKNIATEIRKVKNI